MMTQSPRRTPRYLNDAALARALGLPRLPGSIDTLTGKVKLPADWQRTQLVQAPVPTKFHSPTLLATRYRWVHRAFLPSWLEFWRRVEHAGLLGDILQLGGTWAVRAVRGSTSRISRHSYGVAVDMNVAWNKLGAAPAPAGARGSLARVVPIAESVGWYWGGNFSRPDGMHMELGTTEPLR